MSTFALVHGAWHGSWCWERLVPELERRGHRAVAVDLPVDDPAASFTTYAEVVTRALEGESEDVVVVGHSLGGYPAALVAAARPVRRLVYLCALVPEPGRSLADQFRADREMMVPGYEAGLDPPDELGRSRWVRFDVAWERLFTDCEETDARAAFERLRPQAQAPYPEPFPLPAPPDVPCSSVVCAGDRMVGPEWSRRAARERLGVEVTELPGGHSPFISRPGELAEVLVRGA